MMLKLQLRSILIGLLSMSSAIATAQPQCAVQNCASSDCGCVAFTIAVPNNVPVGEYFAVQILAVDESPCTDPCPLGQITLFEPYLYYNDALVEFNSVSTPLTGWMAGTPIEGAEYVSCSFEGPPYDVANCNLQPSVIAYFNFTMLQEGTAVFSLGLESFYINGNGDEFDICDMSTDSLLPLELLEFTVKLIDEDNALLTWTTTSEVNASHFEIERSFDQAHWVNIGSITASRESKSYHEYMFSDRDLNRYHAEDRIYYRLSIVDLDGAAALSPIASIAFPDHTRLSVVPNPATDVLHISWTPGSATELAMFDLLGREVYTAPSLQSAEQHSIDLKSIGLTDGTYLLQLLNNHQIISSERIVISH